MEKKKNLFTSEAVSIGHPDHVCDRISDCVLDACLKEDKNARVACETMAKDDFIILSGEISTTANINVEQIAKEVGVNREDIVFSFEAIQDPLSLQEPVYNDGTESIYIMDQVSDSKSNDESWADSLTIEQAMKKLNDREKMIITKRFFDGRTQMEVAEEIGISQAQVSRLEKDAIGRIKKLYK